MNEPDFEELYTEALNGGAPVEEDGTLELIVEISDEPTRPAKANW